MDNIIKVIQESIPLTPVQIELVKSKFHFKRVVAADMFLREGEVCRFEAFLTKGLVRTYYNIEGNERIIQFNYEGHWIGDFKSLLLQTPSKLHIQALENCECYIIYKHDIEVLNQQIPNWASVSQKAYEGLFLSKEQHLEQLLTSTAEERYLNLLENQAHMLQRIPQYYLAQYLGVRAESLSRIRNRIAKRTVLNPSQ